MPSSTVTKKPLVRQMAYTPRSPLIRKSSIQEQLAAAIMERDALLELKRERDSRIIAEERANKARHKAQAVSEELRLARLELTHLQALKAEYENRKRLSGSELCESVQESLNQRNSPRLRSLPRLNYKE